MCQDKLNKEEENCLLAIYKCEESEDDSAKLADYMSQEEIAYNKGFLEKLAKNEYIYRPSILKDKVWLVAYRLTKKGRTYIDTKLT